MPHFDYHTSKSAKKRAVTAQRAARFRNANSNADSVTKALPREEKRVNTNTAAKRGNGKHAIPDGWIPKPDTINALSAEIHSDATAYVAPFVDACRAKDYRYKDFDAAFRNCVRQDWPRLRQQQKSEAFPL